MLARILPLPLAVLLAACGNGGDAPAGEEGPAAAQASSGASSAPALTPGRWQVVSTVPGGEQRSEFLCVTAQQAGSGRFLLGELPDGCALERDSMAGGRIDFALRCGRLSSTFTGTYDATSYRSETTIDLGAGEPMRATSVGSFQGPDCQADDVRLEVD